MISDTNARPLAVTGATVIDGNGGAPIKDGVIVIERSRITTVGGRGTPVPPDARKIDARGKFVIPGLMNANVHLFGVLLTLERLARHLVHPEEIIIEGAQVALKNGLTTVFDTWGPRRFLMNVRDQINAGKVVGSRFYCAGNIIGFDGPLSADFMTKAPEAVSSLFAKRVNSIFVENVGRHLMWLTPDGVAKEVRAYIAKGIDFIKYGSNEHYWASAGAFLAFSHRQQAAMVEAAHSAGVTAQAHSMSVEGLHLAVEAGCDLVTHCNVTGPTHIPDETLELMAKRKTGAVIFPQTDKQMGWIKENVSDIEWTLWKSTDINARNLIKSSAPLMLANDGIIWPPEVKADPWLKKSWVSAPEEQNMGSLANGHFFWFRAMEEKGCPPMAMLQAATKNIAVAYKKDKDLGTLEKGKIADLIVLDKDPLQAAENYRSIQMILKDGAIVDRDALPNKPILSGPLEPPAEEEASYVEAIPSGPRLPMCPMCMCR
jgi:imidazolonepropionase-like amidohydrolase